MSITFSNGFECGNLQAESGLITLDSDVRLIGNITFNSIPNENDMLTFLNGKWQAAPPPPASGNVFDGSVEVGGTLNVERVCGIDLASEGWIQRGDDIVGTAPFRGGRSVAISSDGNIVVIGNPYVNPAIYITFVRVYYWNGNNWVQRGADVLANGPSEQFGYYVSVSSDGNVFAAGAPTNDAGTNFGYVKVYYWNGSTWIQRGSNITGEASGDLSGWSVSLSGSGNTVAIGAPQNDGTGSNSGHVRVYDWTGTTWVKRGNDIDGEFGEDQINELAGDQSGSSCDLSEDSNTVAIGALLNPNGTGRGHTRIYDWTGTAWIQRGADIDGEAAGDRGGYSVSLSSDKNAIAIGAVFNDGNGSNSGSTRIYDWSGTAWVKRGNDIDGEAADDNSGYRVSLSSDGNTVAIPAPYNDGNIGNAGQVRVYDWNGTIWVQRGLDVDGPSGSRFGFGLSLSSDGNTFAAGAYLASGNAGLTRIYDWKPAYRSIDICQSHITNVRSLQFQDGIKIGGSATDASAIAIGLDSESLATNSIAIGRSAVSLQNNSIALGYNIATSRVDGFFLRHRGPGAFSTNAAAFRSGDNELVELTSSRRFKDNIRDLEEVSDKFDLLRPVRYNAKPGHGDDREHIGMIAEEVETIFPEFITYSSNGEVTGVMFDRMVAVTIKEMQSLRKHFQDDRLLLLELQQRIL